MKPLYESPRCPRFNTAAVIAMLFVLFFGLGGYISMSLLPDKPIIGTTGRIIQITRLIAIAIGVPILGTAIFAPLTIFIINHLTGRNHFSDETSTISMFAEAYAISENYVLPYAYNSVNKRGEHFCDLYLSFSYAEILHVYQTLKERHQLTYQFHTLSLPNHLGRRVPLLTRAGAEQLIRDMIDSANATGSNVQKQRAILLYSFWPNCSKNVDLPYHQAFISRDVIRDLADLIDANPDRNIPDNAEINAYYDADHVIALSAGYLRTTYARIATEDEFIYLPISPT